MEDLGMWVCVSVRVSAVWETQEWGGTWKEESRDGVSWRDACGVGSREKESEGMTSG